jgi:hypothetical protein
MIKIERQTAIVTIAETNASPMKSTMLMSWLPPQVGMVLSEIQPPVNKAQSPK